MRKLLGTAMVLFFTLFTIGWTGTASATSATFYFDPDDLINLYSTAPLPVNKDASGNYLKYEQDYPRRIHYQAWDEFRFNTFGTETSHTDQESQNAYLWWRFFLDTPDEGLAGFNIWLRDNENAWNWGERLVSNPDVMPTATAASGWYSQVIENPYGSGWLAQWWTDPAGDNLINLVNDHDLFSFTVDVRQIGASGQTYADGIDIAMGTDWDIWFGTMGSDWIANDNPAYVVEGWEGTLELTAVPEPGTILLFGSGLVGLFGIARKRLLKG